LLIAHGPAHEGQQSQDVLSDSQAVAVAHIQPEALGAQHHQRDVLGYGVIECIEHGSGRVVIVDSGGELDQVAPHDLLDPCGVAHWEEKWLGVPPDGLECRRGRAFELRVMPLASS
jgi:hypothetical protein